MAILAVLAHSVRARAVEVIFPGIQPKVSSGAGQTTSRGATALFYNPANLIMSKFIEPVLDVSYATVDYTYTHTDTDSFPDPAAVKVATPLATVGVSLRPIEELAIGVAFLPTGTGELQLIESVPQELNLGTYELVDIENKQTSSKLAAGVAFRPVFPIAIGAGLIRTQEKFETLVYRQSDDEVPAVDALYGGAFMQYVVGARSELLDRALVLAVSYKTAVTKEYTGDIAYGLDGQAGEYQVFEGVGYAPATIGAGVEARFGIIGVFGEVLIEQWSAGRTLVKRGIGLEEPPEKDFKDTTNFAGGIKFWVAPKHMLEASFAIYGSNVGDGLREEDEEGPEDELLRMKLQDDDEEAGPRDNDVAGVGFGDLEAIPRTVFGGGYRMKLQDHGYLQLGAQYQTGTREVPEDLDGEGSYSLTVLALSAGIAFGF
jgi:hypothetical protein